MAESKSEEHTYLSGLLLMTHSLDHLPGVFTIVGSQIFRVRTSVEKKKCTFSTGLFEIGLSLLVQYMEYLETLPMMLPVRQRKKEEYFDAMTHLFSLRRVEDFLVLLLPKKSLSAERVEEIIAVYDAFLRLQFFDGIFDDALPADCLSRADNKTLAEWEKELSIDSDTPKVLVIKPHKTSKKSSNRVVRLCHPNMVWARIFGRR